MVNTINLNTLLGIMIMMLLDHYIYLFQKRLDILINLKKINNFQKITKKYGKKLKD